MARAGTFSKRWRTGPAPVLRRGVALGALAVAVAVVASELDAWRASREGIPAGHVDRPTPHDATVLVLGFRSKTDEPNLVQRWRTRIAIRSVDPERATFVFSGSSSEPGLRSEAAIMAEVAVELGVPRVRIVLEEQSRTTWENIERSIPLLQDATAIVIASNTFHARKARRYLTTQAPDLAARLHRGADHRFGEYALVKPLLALLRR